jgi:hypothetical protein
MFDSLFENRVFSSDTFNRAVDSLASDFKPTQCSSFGTLSGAWESGISNLQYPLAGLSGGTAL